jgi:membrane fusion protein, multidrug efflux system
MQPMLKLAANMFKGNRIDTLSPGKRRGDRKMVHAWVIPILSVTAATFSACNKQAEESAPDIRPVRTVTVAEQAASETVTVTGHIEAENEAALGFRISGRMIERLVNVGDRVAAGQLLAKLDPRDEQNALRSVQAGLTAAQGQLTQARNNFERQKRLLSRGVVSRADYDQAQQQLQTAPGQRSTTLKRKSN